MTSKVPISHLKGVVSGIEQDNEPIDLVKVTPWESWTYDMFTCKYCNNPCDVGYETTFEWGDTNQYTYIDEMCATCLSNVCKKSRNAATSKYVL